MREQIFVILDALDEISEIVLGIKDSLRALLFFLH